MPYVNGIWQEDTPMYNENEDPPIVSPEPDPPEEIPVVPKPITKSILLTIKKMLGISEEYHPFDIDIIVHINSVFLSLNQLGIGPAYPFAIEDEESTWDDFIGDQKPIIQGVQTYVYLKVRLLFDPPTNSFLVDAIQKQIAELEWRLLTQSEYFEIPVAPSNPEDVEEPDAPPTDIPEETPATLMCNNKLDPIDIFSR